jgi:hypothetical protein
VVSLLSLSQRRLAAAGIGGYAASSIWYAGIRYLILPPKAEIPTYQSREAAILDTRAGEARDTRAAKGGDT